MTDPNKEPHILYVSFPSLKDPTHDPGEKIQHTGEVVTFIDWKNTAKWAEKSSWKKRPEEYEKFK